MELALEARPRARAATRPLTGRSAIVTGSTSGIGLGIARALAAEGATIILNGLGDAAAIDRAARDPRIRIVVLTAFALALDAAVGRIERRLLRWQPRGAETARL